MVGTVVIPAPGTVLFSQVSTAHHQLTGVEFHHWWKPRKWYKQSWLTETSESQSRCLSTHQYLQSGSLLWIGRGIFVWGHILKHQSNPAFAPCSRSQCKGCYVPAFHWVTEETRRETIGHFLWCLPYRCSGGCFPQPAISTVGLLVIVKVMTQAWQTFDRDVSSCFQKAAMLTMEHDKYSANWVLRNMNVDVIQLYFWPGLL